MTRSPFGDGAGAMNQFVSPMVKSRAVATGPIGTIGSMNPDLEWTAPIRDVDERGIRRRPRGHQFVPLGRDQRAGYRGRQVYGDDVEGSALLADDQPLTVRRDRRAVEAGGAARQRVPLVGEGIGEPQLCRRIRRRLEREHDVAVVGQPGDVRCATIRVRSRITLSVRSSRLADRAAATILRRHVPR